MTQETNRFRNFFFKKFTATHGDFYGGDNEELKKHFMSGEVKVPVPDIFRLVDEYENYFKIADIQWPDSFVASQEWNEVKGEWIGDGWWYMGCPVDETEYKILEVFDRDKHYHPILADFVKIK